MTLSNKWYNILKPVATTLLPAIAALYLTLAPVWDLPGGEKVSATVAAINTFLGILLGVSSKQYGKVQADMEASSSDGELYVVQDPEDGAADIRLGVKGSVEDLVSKDKVQLQVKQVTPPPVAE